MIILFEDDNIEKNNHLSESLHYIFVKVLKLFLSLKLDWSTTGLNGLTVPTNDSWCTAGNLSR